MNLGCGKNKNNVLWRFFKGFKQRVKGAYGEHMHLIYNINAVF